MRRIGNQIAMMILYDAYFAAFRALYAENMMLDVPGQCRG